MLLRNAFNEYLVLVILAVVNSGIGMFYYLRLLMTAMSKEDNEVVATLKPTIMQYIVLAVCSVALIVGGLITI